MTIEKTMLSCEHKLKKAANNFKGLGNALQTMGLLHRIEKELAGDESIAAIGIKKHLSCEDEKTRTLLFKTILEQVQDGWKGLSENTINDIKKLMKWN